MRKINSKALESVNGGLGLETSLLLGAGIGLISGISVLLSANYYLARQTDATLDSARDSEDPVKRNIAKVAPLVDWKRDPVITKNVVMLQRAQD